jgi:hypothetical protein
LLALVLERHLDGGARACGRCGSAGSAGLATATCCALTGSARSRKTDRTFMCKLLGAASAGAPADWPSWPGRVSVSRPTPYHRARALHARQAGSRLPLAAEDRRAQISGDVRVQRKARGRSAAAFVPDVPERAGVPSP